MRASLRALLGLYRGVQLVGEIDELDEAAAKIAEFNVNVVLMDISQPGASAFDSVKTLRAQFPETKFIVLALDPHVAYARQAVIAGVDGYLLKNLAEELEPALRAVAMGGNFYTRAVTVASLEESQTEASRDSQAAAISPRQREVLKMIADGFTTKEIAANLGISFKTAQTHRTELMQRLDIHEVATLVRYAIRIGLVQSP